MAAANRFDQAAEMPILNTYVPIDFGNLYRIGATQKAAVDEAINQFGNALTTFGQFRSPSQIDTQRYYDLTIGRKDMQDLIQGVVNNPDLIKDPAFRSRLNSAIYSTDFATLSNLEQSKEGLLARQEANRQLILRGGYNPLIHDVDYSNYDTMKSGIYNDVSPLPYTSVVDMVKPYVDNLEDSFMGVQNGWIHKGVSADRTDAQINANWSNIINTPGYSQNLEIIMKQNPGISIQDATNMLNDQIILAGREFTRDEAQRDPWSLYVAQAQYKAAMDTDPTNKMKNLTTLTFETLKRKSRINMVQLSDLDDDAKFRYINYGLEGLNNEEQNKLSSVTNQADLNRYNLQVLNDRMNNYGENPYAAARSVAMNFGDRIGAEASKIFTRQAAGTTKEYSDGSYEVSNVKRFIPLDEIGFNMANMTDVWKEKSGVTETQKKRDRLWNAQDLQAKVLPGGYAVSTNAQGFNGAYLYIPYDQVKKYMNDVDISNSGGELVTRSFDEVSTSTTQRFDYRGNPDGSTIVTRGKTGKFVRFPVVNQIASQGQAAMEADAEYNKYISLSSSARDTQSALSQQSRASLIR